MQILKGLFLNPAGFQNVFQLERRKYIFQYLLEQLLN